MSQENVEIVREFNALFEAGDRRSWRSYFDPNAIWDTSESGILPSGVYRGHAGIEQFFTDWLSTWDDYAIENREFIDGGDAVAVVFRQQSRAAPRTQARAAGRDVASGVLRVYATRSSVSGA